MNIKKIVAAIAAAAVAVSTMAVSAFAAQSTDSLADGTAYLNINLSDWSEFDATWEKRSDHRRWHIHCFHDRR